MKTIKVHDWKTIMKIMPLILLTGAVLLLSSCEGPEGPKGETGLQGATGDTGATGADGDSPTLTCLGCHSEENMHLRRFEYNASQHASGSLSLDYAGGRSYCTQCHSGNGFVEFMTTGSVAENITPTPITCNSCHGLHATFDTTDFALRVDGPITLYMDDTQTVDFGENNNSCVQCHQARRSYTAYDDTESGADSVYISSTHAGPHHGPAGSVVMGLLGDNRNGTTSVDVGPYTAHSSGSCMSCHMPESNHTFEPNLDGCGVADCHPGLDTFDRNGLQTQVKEDLDALAVALAAVGAISIDTVETGVYEYHPHKETVSGPEFSAFWNFMIVLEDKSWGVHNPTLIKALISNAEESLGM